MKIKVDFDRCDGIGMCESLAPDFFEVNDKGELDVLREDVDADSLSDVEEAVASCPTGALRIEK